MSKELKVYHHELRHNEYAEFCLKYEVDKVIAEKDNEIAELKANVNGLKNRTNLWEYNAQNEHNAAVAVRMENIELKAKLENVQASMYCDVVDANMEIRRLKRALWLARAQAADGFATISRWTDYEDMHPDTKIGYRKWYKKFMHVKALCKAKAEEYK